MQSQSLPKPGDIVAGKYRIEGSIGSGGMGVVFEAVHVETEARVAIKWLSPELSATPSAVERFKVEARATGRIRHPNVVAIHDIGEHQGSVFLVMELLRGSSLRARLSQGPCTLAESLAILFPVMRGVSAAHAVKVLHRDLKPENIFLAESPDGLEPIAKVLDFGIAKLSVDSGRTHQTSAHTGLMGTYPYMAFEQLHARGDLDGRVDVYALGAVLYNMLTCRLPYQADNPVDLALRMLQSQPEPVSVFAPSLPAELDAVIERALARDRDQRYSSVDDFALALEPFAGALRYRGATKSGAPSGRPAPDSSEVKSTPPLATPFMVGQRPVQRPPETTAPSIPAPTQGSRRWLYLGTGAAALVLAGILAFAVFRSEDDVTPAPAGHAPPPPPPPPLEKAPQAQHPDPNPSNVDDWAQPAGNTQPAVEVTPPVEPPVEPVVTPAVKPAVTPHHHDDKKDELASAERKKRREQEKAAAAAAAAAQQAAQAAQSSNQNSKPQLMDGSEELMANPFKKR